VALRRTVVAMQLYVGMLTIVAAEIKSVDMV